MNGYPHPNRRAPLAGDDERSCPDASAWPFSDPRVWLIYQYYLSQFSCPKCACAAFGNLDWLPPKLKARIAEMTAQMGGAPLGLSPTGCLPVGTLAGAASLSGCARCAAGTPGQLNAVQRMRPMPKNATFLMLRRRPVAPAFYAPFGGRLRGRLGDASADVYASLSAAQQQAVLSALYSYIIQPSACPYVFTGSGTSTPSGQGINSVADLADPANRGIAVDCFQQGYNATNSTTLGAANGAGVLDAQTYAALTGAQPPTPPNPNPAPVPTPPPAPAASTSSNTGLIVGVAAAALIGGGVLAYALTRPSEPARATVTRTTRTTSTNRRRRARA